MLDREELIQFIKQNDSSYLKIDLNTFSSELLVMIKVRIELEQAELKLKKRKQ